MCAIKQDILVGNWNSALMANSENQWRTGVWVTFHSPKGRHWYQLLSIIVWGFHGWGERGLLGIGRRQVLLAILDWKCFCTIFLHTYIRIKILLSHFYWKSRPCLARVLRQKKDIELLTYSDIFLYAYPDIEEVIRLDLFITEKYLMIPKKEHYEKGEKHILGFPSYCN